MALPPTNLTKNVFACIAAGHNPKLPVLQNLGTKFIHAGNYFYIALILSDGDFYKVCLMILRNNESLREPILNKYAILQLVVYQTVDSEIILETAQVLRSPENVGHCRIGRPQLYSRRSSEIANSQQSSTFRSLLAKSKHFYRLLNHFAFKWSIRPTKAPLTHGALSCMLNSPQIVQPIIQILATKTISAAYNMKRLLLTVTDGTMISEEIYCSDSLMMQMQEYPPLTVVRIESFLPKSEANARAVCVIYKMTGLNRAEDICYTIDLMPNKVHLSTGNIADFCEEDDLLDLTLFAVKPTNVRVMGITMVAKGDTTKRRLRLKVSDGLNRCVVYLSNQLTERVVAQGMFSKGSIVCLVTYVRHLCTKDSFKYYINVLELKLLKEGHAACFAWDIERHATPTLSRHFIERLRDDGVCVEQPVLQIIDLKTYYRSSPQKHKLRLLLFDGIGLCFGWLPSHMSLLRAELLEYPVVQLDAYRTHKVKSGKLQLNIAEMTGLRRQGVYLAGTAKYNSALNDWVTIQPGYELAD